MVLLVVVAAVGGCAKEKAKKQPSDSSKHPDRIVIVDRQATSKRKTVVEKEPNNRTGQATSVALGEIVRGNMDSSNDADYYKLNVGKAGRITARLSGIAKADLILELRDADNKRLARSDRGPAKTVEGLPNFPVKAGNYYLVVTEFVKKKRKKRRRRRKRGRKAKKKPVDEPPARVGKSPNYELSVTWSDKAPSASMEAEPNDKIASAVELKVGAQGTGFIGWSRDKDLWKLLLDEVTGDDVIDIEVSGVTGLRLVLEVLDVSGKRLLRRWGAKGKSVIVRGLRPRSGHEAHFAKVFSRRSQPGESYAVSFSVRKPDPADEVEPNDGKRSGTSLIDGKATVPPQTGGMRRGFLTRGDVDYFRLAKRSQPMAISVTVNPPADVDPVLFVMDGKGTVLSKVDEGKKGTKEYVRKLRIPANTDVLIKISGHGNSAQPETYELRWSVQDAAAAPPPTPTPAAKTGKDNDNDDGLDDEY